jgi:LCP family protein required for cell wall assembly
MRHESDPEAYANDKILEEQLEKLFSDIVLTRPMPVRPRSSTPVAKTQLAAQKEAIGDTGTLRNGHRSKRLSLNGYGWMAGALSTLAIAALVAGFLLISHGKTAESSGLSSPSTPEDVAFQAAPGPSSTQGAGEALSRSLRALPVSHTPRATSTGVRNAMHPAVKTAAPLRVEEIGAQHTAIADDTLPTAPEVPVLNASTVLTVPLANAKGTRPSVPVSPTPTTRPALPAHPATTTPVPAYAVGLSAVPTPVPLVALPEKAINIALLGSDKRPYETSWRTDVIIIVSVNPELPSVSMLSIPRDTWVYIPNWAFQRINLADSHGTEAGYPGGGPGLVKAAIEYNFGIHIDYFARVDFAGLMKVVDALGGIDVLLDCPVADGFPDDPITEDPSNVTQIDYPEPGLYHLDGKHALWLARSRKTTSEFARSRRQHRILRAIWAKANQLDIIARLPELWEQLTTTVTTDLSLDDVLWLASIGLQLEPSQIESGFLDGRHLTAWVSPGGGSVLLPHTEAILNAVEPIFNPYPYKAPQGFSEVEVWDASGHEYWGLLAADVLLRNGFEVANIHRSDELYESTVILDYTTNAKGNPLPLLQRLFNASTANVSAEALAKTNDGVAFRLIVGADYQPCNRPVAAQWGPTPVPATAHE